MLYCLLIVAQVSLFCVLSPHVSKDQAKGRVYDRVGGCHNVMIRICAESPLNCMNGFIQ